ncbi:hypothetical protein METHPM2_20036 [Pseudomonas sp. PM2]
MSLDSGKYDSSRMKGYAVGNRHTMPASSGIQITAIRPFWVGSDDHFRQSVLMVKPQSVPHLNGVIDLTPHIERHSRAPYRRASFQNPRFLPYEIVQ